jgi:hypothetical protein
MTKRYNFLLLFVLIISILPIVKVFSNTEDSHGGILKNRIKIVEKPKIIQTTIREPSGLGPLLQLDPIRFMMTASHDSVLVGQEIELTINAGLLEIHPSSFFVFDEQKGFSIKVLLPESFVQTGGNYSEYIGMRLSAFNKTATYHLRGYFTKAEKNPCFRLLRGLQNAGNNSVFEQKQTLCLKKVKDAQRSLSNARVADCSIPAPTVTQNSYLYSLGIGFRIKDVKI